MYQNPPDKAWLYIGDIISSIELPSLNGSDFHLVPTEHDKKALLVRQAISSLFFVYLSHECDFNDNKRQFFILAPMFNIDSGTRRNDKAFQELIESNNVEECPKYLNHFYYYPYEQTLPQDKLIDFTRVISFPTKDKQLLLERKLLELNEENRKLIKTKISYYFLHP